MAIYTGEICIFVRRKHTHTNGKIRTTQASMARADDLFMQLVSQHLFQVRFYTHKAHINNKRRCTSLFYCTKYRLESVLRDKLHEQISPCNRSFTSKSRLLIVKLTR